MKQQNNIYRIDKFPTQDRSCLETLWELSLSFCQNKNSRMLEEVAKLHFLYNIWQGKNFFAYHLYLMESP